MEQPLLHWTPSIAPSDMILYEGDIYPELKNSFLVTALVSKDVKKVTFDNGKDTQESLFGDKVDGKIKSITDFGIFVGLEGEIDGLIQDRKSVV